MDAVKFVKEINRMCKTYHDCSDCPLDKISYCNIKEIQRNGLKTIEIVEKWSKNHPQKTFLQDFLKKHPNAPLNIHGTPEFCPHNCGYTTFTECEDYDGCFECWNRPMED